MAASDRLQHFADPHMLKRKQYGSLALNRCDICRSSVSDAVGYRCGECDFDIHEACADYFQETISFFAHPKHTLRLYRLPDGLFAKRACDLCRKSCSPGFFVYRCVACDFDVHPLCTMLPETLRSPLHPEHDLHMVPSTPGSCSSCHKDPHLLEYACKVAPCRTKLHIACASSSGTPSPSTGDRVAKFIVNAGMRAVLHAATGGLSSAFN